MHPAVFLPKLSEPAYPKDQSEARLCALYWVQRILSGRSAAGRNYTVESAKRECSMGTTGGREGGWDIRRGKITVPALGPQHWTFSFAQVAGELEGMARATVAPVLVQGMLF